MKNDKIIIRKKGPRSDGKKSKTIAARLDMPTYIKFMSIVSESNQTTSFVLQRILDFALDKVEIRQEEE